MAVSVYKADDIILEAGADINKMYYVANGSVDVIDPRGGQVFYTFESSAILRCCQRESLNALHDDETLDGDDWVQRSLRYNRETAKNEDLESPNQDLTENTINEESSLKRMSDEDDSSDVGHLMERHFSC